MPSFTTQRRVPFTPKEMFDVVADVERYPEFLPLCDSLEIESRTETAEAIVLVARMSVGYQAIRQTFTSRVTLTPGVPSIIIEHLEGPFSRLESRWRFRPAPAGSEIDFHIDYEFSSTLLALIVGAAFDKAVRRYADAFVARAHAVYGARLEAS